MKCCILRKVAYRLPGKKKRLVWAVVIAERDGLSLLFVKKPDEQWADSLVVTIENVAQRCYEDVVTSRFPLEKGDLVSIGAKLQALGDTESEADLANFFKSEDLF